jgi:hypothetical protein
MRTNGTKSRQDLKPRMTVLARTSSILTDRPITPISCRHELVVRQSPTSKDVSTEAEEYQLSRTVTRQRLGKSLCLLQLQ